MMKKSRGRKRKCKRENKDYKCKEINCCRKRRKKGKKRLKVINRNKKLEGMRKKRKIRGLRKVCKHLILGVGRVRRIFKRRERILWRRLEMHLFLEKKGLKVMVDLLRRLKRRRRRLNNSQ
jgi:hypothetical protein